MKDIPDIIITVLYLLLLLGCACYILQRSDNG